MSEQAIFTLNQAAKACGRSKGTISKALASGKLSYLSKDDSGYRIDAAELFRVFPAKPEASGSGVQLETSKNTSGNRPLEADIRGLREQIGLLLSERDDLRRRLDAEAEERRKLTALLTDQREKAPERPAEGLLVRGWRSLFGTG
jgi:hypothetical protein